jgi:hypothetical protein
MSIWQTRNTKRRYERSEPPDVGLVDVFRTTRFGVKRWLGPALLEDISEGGVAMRMDCPMRVGQELHLHTRTVSLIGRVCHCIPLELGYRIGLEFVGKK